MFQKEVFSDLPEDQRGRAAHLLAEKYKANPQVLKDLGVQHGDIDKVLWGGGYKLEVSQQDLDEVIKAVTEHDQASSGQTVELADGKLRLRGTYGHGSSVQRELQTLLQKQYPSLTKEQIGAVAHRAQLELAGDSNAAKGFGIVRGDWNKVPERHSYDVTVDARLLDNEVARVTGKSLPDVTNQRIAAATSAQPPTPPTAPEAVPLAS